MTARVEPETLRKILRYQPETGRLFWLTRTPDMFEDGKWSADQTCALWNARYAGEDAFVGKSNGYHNGTIFRREYKAHRVGWAIVHGEWPDQIDHINGVRDDNRLENLRNVSRSENHKNKGQYRNNKSGVMGVHWRKDVQKWHATIRVDGKDSHLGYFTNKDDAIAARKSAEKERGFHANHGRLGPMMREKR